MKKYFVIAGVLLATGAVAQKKPVAAKKPVPAQQPAKVLKTLSDSASYAIGLSVANFYKHQGISKLNTDVVARAINDVMSGKTALLADEDANTVMMRYMNQAQEGKAKPNIAAGEQFLATNKARAGVKTTASGLQYEVVTLGTGPKPKATDSVTVHYRGTLIDGTEFDNSYQRGEPITFAVNGVIKGWTEALQLMPAGSKYKLYIPHQLAYGTNDVGRIPAGSVLVFEVELLQVGGKK